MRDALTGREPCRWAWGFVERLIDEPWSRWRAKRLGGDHWREHLGWTPDTYLHALLFDAIQVNSAITSAAGTGKRPKAPPPTSRPTARPEPVDPDSVGDDELLAAADYLND